MYCTKCGRKIDESMEFCPDCGETIDIEIAKVRDEILRGAVKYETDAEIDGLSGKLYLTNFKNVYFVSNGKREIYLSESKIDNITRVGRRINIEMKDGEEYYFDTQRDVEAQSLVKKTKWALRDNGVVYDKEVYVEDEYTDEENKDKKNVKKLIIKIVVLLVIVACVWFGYTRIKDAEKKSKDSESSESSISQIDAEHIALDYIEARDDRFSGDSFYEGSNYNGYQIGVSGLSNGNPVSYHVTVSKDDGEVVDVE